MPEKRLLGNDFLRGKNDMHRFKKIFSTMIFFVICIFRMISSFFAFHSSLPFMTGQEAGSRPPIAGRNALERFRNEIAYRSGGSGSRRPRRNKAENHAFSPRIPRCGEMQAVKPDKNIRKTDIFNRTML